jgi:hypothetical protein
MVVGATVGATGNSAAMVMPTTVAPNAGAVAPAERGRGANGAASVPKAHAVTQQPDPESLDLRELDSAEAELQRRYGVPTHLVVHGDAPEHVPADVVAWSRAADARRRQLIDAMRGAPLYVPTDVEPMELRKERLRKPGPPR